MMDTELLMHSYLTQHFWPWPIALAYSQELEERGAAIFAAVEVLEAYPRLGAMADHTGIGAVQRVYETITQNNDAAPLIEETLREIESPLIAGILAGKVRTLGRKSPESVLEPIGVSDWVGAEIHSAATCDLVRAGWRERARDLDAVSTGIERHVWFYDVHLRGSDMTALFGATPLAGKASTQLPEPWTEERMKTEIGACQITSRDKAWAEVFKPRREEHGWDNAAFRDIWSKGRGSQGMTGRPSKRA